jgi:hypothetical protein
LAGFIRIPILIAIAIAMAGPSSKPHPKRDETVFVPHPDDAGEVRAAFEEAERGEVLTSEESAAYLRELLSEDEK